MDANALPLSPVPGRFATLQSATTLALLEPVLSARSSLLVEPVSGRLPSPSPSGTRVSPVAGVWLLEAAGAVGLGAGLDVGAGLSFRAYQWGSGLSAAGSGEDLDAVAFGDPWATLGWQAPLGAFDLRLYGTVFVPLGNSAGFAGERNAHGELGVSTAKSFGDLTVGLDVAGRLREESTFGATQWGNQLRVGIGGGYEFSTLLSSTLELQLMPVLAGQPEPLLGEAGYSFPAEANATVAADFRPWTLLVIGGSGLPISVPSSDSEAGGLRRGPTSPALRLGVEVRRAF